MCVTLCMYCLHNRLLPTIIKMRISMPTKLLQKININNPYITGMLEMFIYMQDMHQLIGKLFKLLLWLLPASLYLPNCLYIGHLS